MAYAEVEERQLLKAMTWWDGFVVALANPGFLIAALGSSIGALGTTGAFVLWTISITFGALQNNIHAELATMFPNKSGGIALYAHEAWRKYLIFVGPVATFGYWIGWSVVLSINGLVAGTLIQAEWFSKNTWTKSGAGFDLSLPIVIGIGLIVLVWLFNVYGVRPAVWFGYLTGALLLHSRLRAHVLPLHHGRLAQLEHAVEHRHRRRPPARAHVAVLHVLVGVRHRGRRHLRPRVPRHAARHAEGAAHVGAVLRRGLRPAAARPGRHPGHAGGRRRPDVHRLLHPGLRRARGPRAGQRHDRLHRRRPGAVDEHGDDGRLARALRHLQGRDDDPRARGAQPIPRPWRAR